jgi:hypothetical protein
VPVKVTRAGGPGDVSRICAKIAPGDVQKLFKGPPPNLSASPGQCSWGGTQVTVNIYLEDTAHTYYTGGPIDVSSPTPLAGVGGTAPPFTVSPAEALKYAQAEGQLCTDVFAAADAAG